MTLPRLIFTGTLAALACAPVLAESQGDIGYASVEAARSSLQQRDDTRMSIADGWLTIEDPAAMTIWTFAPEIDPAHPAVIKRSVIEEDGRIVIRMDIRCEGDGQACDGLEQHFLGLNQATRDQVREDSQDDAAESEPEPES
ncbi:MAG: hypothetical protein M0Q42_03260 [Xanthomonadales bacterium]|nr:hypothetical protein [Xanthomonadales bacterium]